MINNIAIKTILAYMTFSEYFKGYEGPGIRGLKEYFYRPLYTYSVPKKISHFCILDEKVKVGIFFWETLYNYQRE